MGIMGAGMMGAGIAYVSANAGIDVVLLDQEQANADKGKAHAESILDKGISRKKVTEDKKAEVLDRITATTRLRCPERLRPDRGSGFRRSQDQGRGNEECRSGGGCGLYLRHQHLDPADKRIGKGQRSSPSTSSASTSFRRWTR